MEHHLAVVDSLQIKREFLQNDLAELSPKTVFLLGRTSLIALKSVDRYKQGLSGYKSITKSCGTSVEVIGSEIIFRVFPSSRNLVYRDRIQKAFERVKGKGIDGAPKEEDDH